MEEKSLSLLMMEKIILTIKDGRKLRFLMELLKQFDFVEIEKSSSKSRISDKKHDLFASAGMWKNREINSEELRKRAWKKAS